MNNLPKDGKMRVPFDRTGRCLFPRGAYNRTALPSHPAGCIVHNKFTFRALNPSFLLCIIGALGYALHT